MSTNASQPNRAAVPIAVTDAGAFRIYRKDDGNDYWGLVERFRAGALPVAVLPNNNSRRRVYRVEAFGRRMVLKWDPRGERTVEEFLLCCLHGSFYPRLMFQVRRAVANGCDFIQDVHLVAVRTICGVSLESFALFDYLDGVPLSEMIRDYRDPALKSRPTPEQSAAALAAIAELHRYGLRHFDPNPTNFLVGDGGALKIIDLSARCSALFALANDAVKLKHHFGATFPVEGFLNRAACFLIRSHRGFMGWQRRHKRRLKTRLAARFRKGRTPRR